ncbi:hypothetical protein LX69_03511 [Breznakibacter xylanolyticus]|uniref:Uncharacterized protein n=1 Tax=Breznakibacter xylanolyticus TaxID=990 RepID=A0A2W7NA03_9BACT|nr:hypothetical protein LX69_03511 [Breznakibacter xylanolyticus]
MMEFVIFGAVNCPLQLGNGLIRFTPMLGVICNYAIKFVVCNDNLQLQNNYCGFY